MLIDFNNLNINQLSFNTDFERKVESFLKEWLTDETTVKVQTSGSTGIPKIFDIEKKKMINSAVMTCNFLELKKGNTALLCLPVEYISGKMMIVRSMERSLRLVITDPSLQPVKNLEKEIDFCAMTPLQVENSLDKLHLIKNLIIGGAAVSESLKNKMLQMNLSPSNRIFETYGMSETLSHIALRQILPQPENYFTAFENVSVSLDDRGCLKIFAPNVNVEVLQTNDLVEIKNNNQFRFLGRIDNVINSGGAKIFPEALEALVKKEIPNEAVFIGMRDESLGQKLVLIIEGNESEDLKTKIKEIPFEKNFHSPKEILFIKEIPRTSNGKINRLELHKIMSENK
ncbi:AMP-dependent synthetase [Chryseobacterium lactis]|uniref:AMP-dependent synthetase n=1 Tax=Chryseobacterium lactis TaxID=1241981 RepID=A0A3G6RL62_CHRLC|nr:AMP-binding protein [Chryseobacterium lactis]AZA80690.1 long-chain fatty acid--CoA ligase [Chryseobacterium lactis]AZB05692.1 long-chain fatty acid--CoA ligase [Chryseobacterium lactis]PNW13588.1 AMP-dependent synthetase [Chryseobacterium lactis]